MTDVMHTNTGREPDQAPVSSFRKTQRTNRGKYSNPKKQVLSTKLSNVVNPLIHLNYQYVAEVT